MSPRTLITLGTLVALATGTLAFSPAHTAVGSRAPAEQSPTDNPALYAEVSTTSPPLVPAPAHEKKLRLPILVYHIVRPSYPSDSAAVRDIAVTPETFDAQMNY